MDDIEDWELGFNDIEYCHIPLRNRKKEITGHTKIDFINYYKVNEIKWHITTGNYAKSTGIGLMHRYIMNAKKSDPFVDHINGDPLDNRIENLRFSTNSQNSQNKTKKEGCSSKYIGVKKKKKSWECQIRINGKRQNKNFEKEIHAAYFYDLLALKHYGPDAKINKVKKPDDFVDPIEKNKTLPKCITTEYNKYRVNIKGKYVGRYKTEQEAVDAYNEKIKEIKKEEDRIEELRLKQEIKRNKDGVAIIEIFNANKEKILEVLVDDDKYYELDKYWWTNRTGYVYNKDGVLMHRYLLNAKKEDPVVDHINKNKLDNRIANLRFSTSQKNSHNKTKTKNSTSNYFGVNKRKGVKTGYTASISKDGIAYRLGTYTDEIEAAKVYDKKARELYGSFANLNFPDKVEEITKEKEH